MDAIITSALAKLFDTTPKTIADLGKRGIIKKGEKRGSWPLYDSMGGYVKHLRDADAGRKRASGLENPHMAAVGWPLFDSAWAVGGCHFSSLFVTCYVA
jgi:hypothetical protein